MLAPQSSITGPPERGGYSKVLDAVDRSSLHGEKRDIPVRLATGHQDVQSPLAGLIVRFRSPRGSLGLYQAIGELEDQWPVFFAKY